MAEEGAHRQRVVLEPHRRTTASASATRVGDGTAQKSKDRGRCWRGCARISSAWQRLAAGNVLTWVAFMDGLTGTVARGARSQVGTAYSK